MKKIIFLTTVFALFSFTTKADNNLNYSWSASFYSILYPYQTLRVQNNLPQTLYITIDGNGFSVNANTTEDIYPFVISGTSHSVKLSSSYSSFSYSDFYGNTGSTDDGNVQYSVSGTMDYYSITVLPGL